MADFLDLVPDTERTETFPLNGGEVQIYPLKNKTVAALAKRFPDLRKSLFKDAPDDIRGMATIEAAAAIAAAGLGKLGDVIYETRAEKLPQPELMRLVGAIFALTYPSPEAANDNDPLVSAAEIIAEAEAEAA